MMRTVRFVSVPLMLFFASIVPAAAQGLGVRAGVSADPDQFYFGGHVETAPVVDQLRFRPNIEIGMGNDLTVLAVNLEFVYPIVIEGSKGWSVYAGAGPALNVIDTDAATNSEGGFNILAGVAHEGGLFAEVKFGLLDSPDFKVGVGYTFRWR